MKIGINYRTLSHYAFIVLLFWLIKCGAEYEQKEWQQHVDKFKKIGVQQKAYVYEITKVGHARPVTRCLYRFDVNGTQYEGHYDSRNYSVGDSISIFYDPANPAINQSKISLEY